MEVTGKGVFILIYLQLAVVLHLKYPNSTETDWIEHDDKPVETPVKVSQPENQLFLLLEWKPLPQAPEWDYSHCKVLYTLHHPTVHMDTIRPYPIHSLISYSATST